jgi:hypothetical protein
MRTAEALDLAEILLFWISGSLSLSLYLCEIEKR